jgi:WD40 repeat protein
MRSANDKGMKRFGRYEILGEIARGGMGIIYEAKDPQLNRVVALKVMIAGEAASQDMIRRFHVEVTSAARLRHPNIVAIHEVGIEEGQHYFTMDFVDGKPLSELMGERKLGLRQSLEILEKVARAVHYAHTQGIIHRDLKPGNVLIDSHGEPQVTDFGLAKDIETDFTLTQSGAAMGTPAYMSPEQASGASKRVDGRSDVFSLGAMLYEMVAGRPPFTADSRYGVMRQIVEDDPVRPRALTPSVPADVETVCLRCLAKEPERRYQSAQELADDLRRLLNGEPVLARPSSVLYRTKKRLMRNKAATAIAALAILGGIGLLTGWVVTLQRRTREAIAARNVAEQREGIARRHLYAAQMRQVHDAWEQGAVANVLRLLDGLRPRPGQEDVRGFEWSAYWGFCHAERLALRGHTDGVNAAAFSPNGRMLATASWDKTIKLWDAATGTELTTLRGHAHQVACVAFSPDGARLASGGGAYLAAGGEVKLWDISSRKAVADLKGLNGRVMAVAFSPNGEVLAAGGQDPVVKLWDSQGRQELGTLRHGGGVLCLAFSADSKTLAVGAAGPGYRPWEPSEIALWEVADRKKLGTLRGHRAMVQGLAFLADGKTLLSASFDGTMKTWDVARQKELASRADRSQTLYSLALSPNGRLLAAAGASRDSGEVKLWDVARLEPVATVRGHTGVALGVAFSPDSRTLATASADRSARLWTLTDSGELEDKHILARGRRCGIRAMAFSSDGKTLVTGSSDETVKLWDTASGGEVAALRGHTGGVNAVALLPKQNLLATAADDGSVVLWDLAARQPRSTLRHGAEVTGLAPSPDGSLLATATANSLQVWEAATGQERASLGASASALAFYHDGKLLAAAEHETVKLWDVGARRLEATLEGHTGTVWAVACSPDGRFLASGAEDRTVRVWDLATRKELMAIPATNAPHAVVFSPDGRFLLFGALYGPIGIGGGKGTLDIWRVPGAAETRFQRASIHHVHSHAIVALAVSPDSSAFATGAEDGTLKLWDMESRTVRRSLRGHATGIWAAAFAPDGKTLAVARADSTIRLLDPATGREIRSLDGHEDVVCSIAFSPDGATLASGGYDRTLRLWDVATGQLRTSSPRLERAFLTLAFSSDGTALASGQGWVDDPHCELRLWDPATGKERTTLARDLPMVRRVLYSPDGNLLAIALGEAWANKPGKVILWDLTAGKESTSLVTHRGPVLALAFSPDGKTLATGSWDRTIKLWDTATGTELATLEGHEDGVLCLAFSPDGKTLVSGGWDKTVRVWDPELHHERGTLRWHTGAVASLAFSPDGTLLVTADEEGGFRAWPTALNDKR